MKTRVLLIGILLIGAVCGYAQNVDTFVRHQLSEYPKSRLLDIYKSCFQDYMGPEHIVKDTAQVRRYMDYELSHFSIPTSKLPYYEPCGLKGRFFHCGSSWCCSDQECCSQYRGGRSSCRVYQEN